MRQRVTGNSVYALQIAVGQRSREMANAPVVWDFRRQPGQERIR